ncbi:hypothetical protein B0H12DRAFT_1136351 [Mycena haematopus]|nr:hypothetical protein B0H12DRAFT_1136351 [Mycena haematopus]
MLQEDHVDALDCRLEYWSESKTLIVTYASGVHESFNFLFKPIVRIADGIPGFFVETNTDILLPSHSSLTPDFAFAELGVERKHHITFECAWSQPEDHLAEKIKKYFTREDISAVVSLCIHYAGKYERPKHSAPSGYQIVPAAVVEADRRGLLSPVIIDGHTWGPGINAISLTIYCRGGQPQVFQNLCPVAGKFTDDQIAMHYEIHEIFLNLLVQAVTLPALVDALGTGKFALDWQEFIRMLDFYQRTDAYTRYLKWGRKPILKRPREGGLGAATVKNLDQATILQLLGPPPLKKPKS